MYKKHIGIIGIGVMGKNLAINIENKGYSVSIFNRSKEKIDKFILKCINKKIFPFYSIKEFVNSLSSPKCILLMVKSGKIIDNVINLIKPFLKDGDIIIDGGNSYFKDTIYRFNKLKKKKINFVGIGFSGGEEGALNGPCIMIGCKKSIYKFLFPIFNDIAAYVKKEKCLSYIGPDGSGHYVKMIHNGIEYSDMQLISESYFLMKQLLNINNIELSKIFNKWNNGELDSYLLYITKNIFIKKDSNGYFIIDKILDESCNKGTGKWMSKNALDLGEPISLITESVFFRFISMLKDQRNLASKILIGPKINLIYDKTIIIEKIRRSLYLGRIISYAQGFSQLKVASEKYNWNINYYNLVKIFRGGCIIRGYILKYIINTFLKYPNIKNILLSPYFKNIVNFYQKSLRFITMLAIYNGIAVPVLNSAISYYDNYRSEFLSANLIQAQRDYFGAHLYKRIDKQGLFHTKWF